MNSKQKRIALTVMKEGLKSPLSVVELDGQKWWIKSAMARYKNKPWISASTGLVGDGSPLAMGIVCATSGEWHADGLGSNVALATMAKDYMHSLLQSCFIAAQAGMRGQNTVRIVTKDGSFDKTVVIEGNGSLN